MNEEHIKHYTIPVFIPELACPFQCVFCDQKKISGRLESPLPGEIKQTIDRHISTFPPAGRVIEIGFFGGNFTGIPVELQELYLKTAEPYINSGIISGIRLSTRPDYISSEKLSLLKRYGVKVIELGAQSLNADVLRLSGRGHSLSHIEQASGMIIREGFSLGLQMMIGLPGDTLERSISTALRIAELGADNTRIYPTLVIKGTKLEEMYLRGKYTPLSLREAVEWSKEVLKIFEARNVSVIRMGLHPSEGLLSGECLAAGPYHISFRELVLTSIWGELLKPLCGNAGESITVSVPPAEYNYAIGYGAVNKKELNRCFRRVKFTRDASLTGREFNADYY